MTHLSLLQFILHAINTTWDFWTTGIWKIPLKILWIIIKMLWNFSPVIVTLIYGYILMLSYYIKSILTIIYKMHWIKSIIVMLLSWKKSVICIIFFKKSIKIITILYVYNATACWVFSIFWLKVVLACLIYPYFLIGLTFIKKLYNALGFYGCSWDAYKCSRFLQKYIFRHKLADNSGTFFVVPLPLPANYLKIFCLKRVNLPIKYIFYFRPYILEYRRFKFSTAYKYRWRFLTPIQVYNFYKLCGTSWWALYYFKCCGFVYQGIAARIERINYYWIFGISERYYTAWFVYYDIILTLHLTSCMISFHFFMVLTHQDITNMSVFAEYFYFNLLPWFPIIMPTMPYIMVNTSATFCYNFVDILLPGSIIYHEIIYSWFFVFVITFCIFVCLLNYPRNWRAHGLFLPTPKLQILFLILTIIIFRYICWLYYVWCLYALFYNKTILTVFMFHEIIYF